MSLRAGPTFPAAGASPRIDAIKKAGVLRVGVLANAPWLVENATGGSGGAWSGPAWLLANEYAKRLNVKLEAVPVSHETKVPVLASNQVDISVTPLAETPERLKMVDFIIYPSTSVCCPLEIGDRPAAGARHTPERPERNQDDMLREVQAGRPEFFDALLVHAHSGYDSRPEVIRPLGIEVWPSQPRGYHLDPSAPRCWRR